MIRVKNHQMAATTRVDGALHDNDNYQKPNLSIAHSSNSTTLLGRNFRALLQQSTDRKPHGIAQAELVLQFGGLLDARIRIVPFGRRNPAQHEQAQGHTQIGHAQVDPHLGGEGRHERERRRWLFGRFAEQNGNAQVHEGHREVDATLALRCDGEIGDG